MDANLLVGSYSDRLIGEDNYLEKIALFGHTSSFTMGGQQVLKMSPFWGWVTSYNRCIKIGKQINVFVKLKHYEHDNLLIEMLNNFVPCQYI